MWHPQEHREVGSSQLGSGTPLRRFDDAHVQRGREYQSEDAVEGIRGQECSPDFEADALGVFPRDGVWALRLACLSELVNMYRGLDNWVPNVSTRNLGMHCRKHLQ